MLLLDNSVSMLETSSTGAIRADLVYNSAKNLVTKMLTGNDKLKIGIASFSCKDDIGGTAEDAKLVSELTDNLSTLTSAIDTTKPTLETGGSKTNLDAGLKLADQYFSSANNNKYIIVLTDGVPNIAVGNNDIYSPAVTNQTKNTLQSLAQKYKIISMLSGVSYSDTERPRLEETYPDTFNQIIAKVFGTTDEPTAEKFYYVTEEKIEETVNQKIYDDLLPQSQSITNIKINDFFPKEIVDNFDFAYISEPSKGTITQSIDNENKIVWSIDELKSGETATVQYTLTLKDNYDSSIVNKILDTNEKVDITYKDFDGTDKTKTSDETPKVRITVPLKGKDPTTAPTPISPAGKATLGLLVVSLLAFAAFSGTGIFKINHDTKKQ